MKYVNRIIREFGLIEIAFYPRVKSFGLVSLNFDDRAAPRMLRSYFIPKFQRYMLKKKKFHKHGEQIGILNVLNREAILIHVANDAQRELMGCIAPVTKLTGSGKGADSLKALN